MVTAANLVFIGGNDPFLYAFDGKTGRELAAVPLERAVTGNPMTYRTTRGRQLIVVATGDGLGGELVALAPRR